MRTERQNLVRQAVLAASRACGGRPELYARLGVSGSWVYQCIRKGGMPLKMAISVHLLTGGDYLWHELATPELNDLFKRIKKSATEDELRLAILALKNQ